MNRVTVILPILHDLDLDDFEARAIVQDGIEAKLGPCVLTIRKRARTPYPIVVVDGDIPDR